MTFHDESVFLSVSFWLWNLILICKGKLRVRFAELFASVPVTDPANSPMTLTYCVFVLKVFDPAEILHDSPLHNARAAAMDTMRKVMFFLNIRTCQPSQVITQIKIINLNIRIKAIPL